jgi:bifunctional DNA-binding transcriptional regulator/antitoxin component of YhaV-PrlF toxin-antitoxin module
VGTKGEILPKKKMREAAGIHPGDRVTVSISPGQIHIRKILTVNEALSLPIIKKGTIEEFERMIADEEKEIMEKL